MEKLIKNYKNLQKDIIKSIKTPLLVELNFNDIKGFSDNSDIENGFNIALSTVKEIYDYNLIQSNKSSTNVVYIDTDKIKNETTCMVLEQVISQLDDSIKKQYNLDIVKEGTKSALSFGGAGIINNLFGDVVTKGVNLIADLISTELTDEIIDYVVDDLGIADEIIGEIQSRVFSKINEFTVNSVDELSSTQLYLSRDAKKFILENSKEFGKDLSSSEIYQLILKILFNISIGSPIVIFVKNPQNLDNSSISLISLLLSVGKDVKDKNKHTGVSVVYAYCDESFQPYKECEEKYIAIQNLLDTQRLFAQRYSMIERPTSDIPFVAVKSNKFVGRKEELEELKDNYETLRNNISSDIHRCSFQVIKADPGIGKTKLVKKHIEELRNSYKDSQRLIQLTILNQTGNSSTNTGLAGLKNSIIEEAQRLKTVSSLVDKGLEKGLEYIKDKAVDTIFNIFDYNAVQTSKAIFDRARLVDKIQMFQNSNIEESKSISKEEEFEQFNSAISTLEQTFNYGLPIVLFIDDLQWIDNKTSEYVIKHLMKKFNVHVVTTVRNSDSKTVLKESIKNRSLNEFKISILEEAGVIEEKKESIHELDTFQTNLINLKGFNESNLTELISLVIKGDTKKHQILAKTIIETLSSNEYVNTLFAVETINMLCDEKFYENDKDNLDDKELLSKKLIVHVNEDEFKLKINDKLSDDEFNQLLHKSFEILNKRYEDSLSHYNISTNENDKQTFNLMAYAVLEERLNILQSYFSNDDYGNAAVNTLLFSSLLGAPFSSSIVENVLEELSNTKIELLQPLKDYINQSENKNLKYEHYEVIEEVYEILSRYVSINNAYEYKHSLLNIFLEKQFDYMLEKKVFKGLEEETLISSKDKLYELIINCIVEENKRQVFYEKVVDSLNTSEFNNMLFFGEIELNVLKKGFKSNPNRWAKEFTISCNNLSYLYYTNGRYNKALELIDMIFNDFTNEDIYERYLILSNKITYLCSMGLNKNAENLVNNELKISEDKNNSIDHGIFLKNVSGLYTELDYDKAELLCTEAIKIFKKNNMWDQYLLSLSNLALLHSKKGNYSKSLKTYKKFFVLTKEFKKNWLNEIEYLKVKHNYFQCEIKVISSNLDFNKLELITEKVFDFNIDLKKMYEYNKNLYKDLYQQTKLLLLDILILNNNHKIFLETVNDIKKEFDLKLEESYQDQLYYIKLQQKSVTILINNRNFSQALSIFSEIENNFDFSNLLKNKRILLFKLYFPMCLDLIKYNIKKNRLFIEDCLSLINEVINITNIEDFLIYKAELLYYYLDEFKNDIHQRYKVCNDNESFVKFCLENEFINTYKYVFGILYTLTNYKFNFLCSHYTSIEEIRELSQDCLQIVNVLKQYNEISEEDFMEITNWVDSFYYDIVTLDNLLYYSKGFSVLLKSETITIGHLFYSLCYVELTEDSKDYFLELFDLNENSIKELNELKNKFPREFIISLAESKNNFIESEDFKKEFSDLKKILGNYHIGKLI